MPTRKQLEQQYIQDKAFWGSISSRWRGLAGGIGVGAAIGAAVGLVSAIGFGFATGTDISTMGLAGSGANATLATVVGLFTAAGMLVGGAMWSNAGQVSGAIAAGLMAQKELAQGESKALEQEIEVTKDVPLPKAKPLFKPGVMAVGALVASAVGATLAYNGLLPSTVAQYALLGQGQSTLAAAGAAAATFGAFGAVFGVAFEPFRAFKDWTDGLFESRLTGRSTGCTENIMAHLKEAEAAQAPEVEHAPTPRFVERLNEHRARNDVSFHSLT